MDGALRYQVTRVSPREQREALCHLWAANLPVVDVAEKFRRAYVAAPAPPSEVLLLSAVVGEGAPVAVGTAGVFTRRFALGGRDLRAALLADLAVSRGHRTALPALRLVRAAREYALAGHDLVYGFPAEAAEAVHLRCGHRRLGTMRRHVRFLRHGPFLGRLGEVPWLPALLPRLLERPALRAGAAWALDMARALSERPRWAWAHLGYRLQWLEEADSRFDALWCAAGEDYGVAGARGEDFLRWRFPARPGRRVAALVERAGRRRLGAYAVVEVSDGGRGAAPSGVAHLRDLFGHPRALSALLALLPEALRAEGHGALSFAALVAPWLGACLRERGFWALPGGRGVCVSFAPSLGAEGPRGPWEAARWHLCDADEDG